LKLNYQILVVLLAKKRENYGKDTFLRFIFCWAADVSMRLSGGGRGGQYGQGIVEKYINNAPRAEKYILWSKTEYWRIHRGGDS
jgi:hypothetical protein